MISGSVAVDSRLPVNLHRDAAAPDGDSESPGLCRRTGPDADNGQRLRSAAACAADVMVGDEDKDCIVEPGLFASLIEKLANGVVSVLHRAIAPITGFDVDPVVWIGAGAMVGRRHQLQQERREGQAVEHSDRWRSTGPAHYSLCPITTSLLAARSRACDSGMKNS